MDRLPDLAEAHWLEQSVGKSLFAGAEPPSYAAAARIFHAMYESSDPLLAGTTHHERRARAIDAGLISPVVINDINLDSVTVASGVPTGWVRKPQGWMRLRWRELAQRHGLPFTGEERNERLFHPIFPKSWPASIQPPTEGSLDVETFQELVSVLLGWSGDVGVEAFYCLLALERWETNVVYRGRLSEMPSLLAKPEFRGSPQNWWADDHSWVVYTDIDLTTTTLSGPPDLVDRIVCDAQIESYRVAPVMSESSELP